jgi:hypothetical protein
MGKVIRRGKVVGSTRDSGGFIALPWAVVDSEAYQTLSHPAKSLLIEMARQYIRDNNGRLLASYSYLRSRGWTSADTITRAKRELISAGLIYETVMGHRPNKASWYAVTFHAIDRLAGYDPGAYEAFERSAYRKLSGLRPLVGSASGAIGPNSGQDEC